VHRAVSFADAAAADQDVAYAATLQFSRSQQTPARQHASCSILRRPVDGGNGDQRLADFPRINHPDEALKVVVAPFEDALLEREACDTGMSATAFYWLDEDTALVKITSLLRPGSWWAAVWR
jgi:hypothetical protein